MKKIYYIIILSLLLMPTLSIAQRGGAKEELEAFKVAFITRELNLNPEEAKVFWPVYNLYETEMKAVKRKHRFEKMETAQDFENMNDKELEAAVNNEVIFRQQELDVVKKFLPQFKSVLPIRKVALLFRAEQEFKKELVRRLRNNRP